MNDQSLQAGEKVQFRLGDIHLPDLAEVIARMTEDTELQGTVSLLSDQGERRGAFAVIEVKGVLMPLIVPASCLKRSHEAEALIDESHEKEEKKFSLEGTR